MSRSDTTQRQDKVQLQHREENRDGAAEQTRTGPEVKDHSIFTLFFIYSFILCSTTLGLERQNSKKSFLQNPFNVSDSDPNTWMIKSPVVCFHRSSCLFLSWDLATLSTNSIIPLPFTMFTGNERSVLLLVNTNNTTWNFSLLTRHWGGRWGVHYNSYDYHTRLKNRLMSQTHLSGGQVGISPGSHRVQADFCCSWYFLFSISSQHERKCLWAKCICVRNIQRRNYFLWHTEPEHAFKGPNNITTHPGCNQQTRRIPTLGQRGRQPGPSHSEETTEKREEEVVKNMTDNREGRNRGQRSEVNHSYESVCGERFNEETLRGNIWSEDLRGSAQKCAEV